MRGHAAIVKILFCYSANPNTKTKKGAIAQDLANIKCYEDVIDILKRGGADIAMPNPDQWDDNNYLNGER